MRVLHIGKYFPPFQGGIENFMFDLMRACARLGIAQAALVHQHDRGKPFEEEAVNVDGGEAFTVYKVPIHGQLVYAPVSPSFGRRLSRVAAMFKPDIVHVHLPNTSAFWLLGLRGLRPSKLVVHWHADVLGPGAGQRLRLAYRGYRPFERALLRRADAVIATSPNYLASSEALRPWRKKCHVISLAMDPVRVGGAQEGTHSRRWRDPQALKVFCIGRFAYYKGLDYLLDAVAQTRGVELILAGDGEERTAIETTVRRKRLETRVHLPGRLSDSERNDYMLTCDLFCLPSINRNEAFGLVLLEAMALGTPAIVTRVPGSGMSWVVEDGRTGWHAQPADAASIAAVLVRARDNRVKVLEMGKAAKQRFGELFAIQPVASQVAGLYREMVFGGHRSGAPPRSYHDYRSEAALPKLGSGRLQRRGSKMDRRNSR